jgi:hypothetical protein
MVADGNYTREKCHYAWRRRHSNVKIKAGSANHGKRRVGACSGEAVTGSPTRTCANEIASVE